MGSLKAVQVEAVAAPASASAQVVAHNLRRIMAECAMTYDEVVEAASLDVRTVRAIARGEQTAHARSLRKLADGLGVAVEQLLIPPTGLSQEAFDAATNPAVQRVRESHPELFEGWESSDYADLASRFGVGGELSDRGAIAEAEQLNRRRDVLRRAKVVLETDQADMLIRLVDLLYDKVRIDR